MAWKVTRPRELPQQSRPVLPPLAMVVDFSDSPGHCTVTFNAQSPSDSETITHLCSLNVLTWDSPHFMATVDSRLGPQDSARAEADNAIRTVIELSVFIVIGFSHNR